VCTEGYSKSDRITLILLSSSWPSSCAALTSIFADALGAEHVAQLDAQI